MTLVSDSYIQFIQYQPLFGVALRLPDWIERLLLVWRPAPSIKQAQDFSRYTVFAQNAACGQRHSGAGRWRVNLGQVFGNLFSRVTC